jgi:hypothetical protein
MFSITSSSLPSLSLDTYNVDATAISRKYPSYSLGASRPLLFQRGKLYFIFVSTIFIALVVHRRISIRRSR